MTKFAHFRRLNFALRGHPIELKGGSTAAYIEANGVGLS